MTEATRLHERMFDTIQAHDLDALRSLYHSDYVYTDEDGKDHPGADAGVEVAKKYTTAFPDLGFTILHQYADGDNISVMELDVTGTHQAELEGIPATNRRISAHLCNIIEVRDGKIHREREYFDNMALLSQLGVAPAATAT